MSQRRRRAAVALTTVLAVGLAGCRNTVYVRPDLVARAGQWDARTPDLRLLLIGDAGLVSAGQQRVMSAARTLARDAHESTIVWLGDNVYPRGMPSPGADGGCARGTDDSSDEGDCERARAEANLRPQIAVSTQTGSRGYFVPGNHDWDKSGARGRERILAQSEFLREEGEGLTHLLPDGACPGPLSVDLSRGGAQLRLIFMDTNLLLFPDRFRPLEGCTWGPVAERRSYAGAIADNAEIHDKLVSMLQEAARDSVPVVVAGHHPIYTRGSHGGYHPLTDYVFPLQRTWQDWLWLPLPIALMTGLITKVAFGTFVPIPLGVLYPPLRRAQRLPQDLGSDENEALVDGLRRAFRDSGAAPLIYAAGHEHNLQVFGDEEGMRTLYVVSGSGTYVTLTGLADNMLMKAGERGLVVVDVFSNPGRGAAEVRVEAIATGTGVCGSRSVFCGRVDPATGAVTPCPPRPCF